MKKATVEGREPGARGSMWLSEVTSMPGHMPAFFGETVLGLWSPGHEGLYQGFHIKWAGT